MDYVELKLGGCTKECSFDRQCLRHVDDVEMYNIRRNFWGRQEDDPYLPKRRLQSIQTIFSTCEGIKVNTILKINMRYEFIIQLKFFYYIYFIA